MAKIVLLFVFGFLLKNSNSVFSQNAWEKRYYDYTNSSPYMYSADTDLKFDTIGGKYFFVGESHGGLTSVYMIDTLGNILFRNYYSGIAGGGKNWILTKDGGIIVSDIEGHNGNSIKTLFKTDSNYTIQWKYQYEIPLSTGRCGLVETMEDNFVLVGTAHFTSYVRPFLIKTDSLGAPLTIKYYTDLFAYPRKIIQTRDENYLIAANAYLSDGAVLFKTDTSGVVLWCKSYFRPKGFINDIFEKENGNLIVVGNTDTTFQTPSAKMFVMEVDSAGNTLWTKTYGDSINRFIFRPVTFSYFRPIKIKQTFDGGYIIVNSIMVSPNFTYEDIVLLKVDSIGNVQWERRHGTNNQYEIGINIIQTPDTGYFVAGVFNTGQIFEEGYYFLKTDSLGSVGCDEYSDIIAQSSLLPTDSNIFVTDSTLVINQYIALVNDTIRLPPDSLPGCIVDGIAANYFEVYEFSVYPNPSSGVVHLSTGSADNKDVFIYDLMGKEIYSKRNTLETDLNINLSKNAKGIYLLTVTSHTWRATAKVVLY